MNENNAGISVIEAYPPNIEDIKKVFPIESKQVVFAYGDIIYNPSGGPITEPLRIHELTHCAQQGIEPRVWWDRYLVDKEFRLEQEIEAFSNELNCFRFFNKDRNKQVKYLFYLAGKLSGELYQNMCTRSEAQKLIKDHADKGNTRVRGS